MRLKRYLTEAKEQIKDWKKYVSSNKELSAAIKIMEKINKKKYKAYLVGGAVRDIILGTPSHDYDICTNCNPEVLSTLYKLYPIGSSGDFGIWVVKEGGFSFEVAQMRGESYEQPKYVRKIIK